MRIAILLFIVGICLVSAKYLPYEIQDSNTLLRVKRADDSDDSSNSVEQDKDDDDDGDSDDDSIEKKLAELKRQEKEDKMKRKALENEEKEKRKQEEQQRKLEEKEAKKQRKEEEKKQKEERKQLEKLEKEKLKENKRLEKLSKEEKKKQDKQQKELLKLEKETLEGKYEKNDFLETEEENSVELADVWRNHIYVKYGLTLTSTKLEKQAALSRYLQEELGINQNSTESERRQAIVRLIQTKLQTDAAEQNALKDQLMTHINAVSIQKLRVGLEKDLEELNNKTQILENVTLPWVPEAKQQIEEKRSFLQTIEQFLSNILPNWVLGGQNVPNPNKNDNSPSASGPDNGISSGSSNDKVIPENNVNLPSDGNGDLGTAPSNSNPDSNNGVPSGNNNLIVVADKDSTAQGSTPVTVVENNNNGNSLPASSSTAGSGASNAVSAVNKNENNDGIVSAEGNTNISNNGANIASTNIKDDAPSGDVISTASSPTELSPEIESNPVIIPGSSNTGINENSGLISNVAETDNIQSPNVITSEVNKDASDNNIDVDTSSVPVDTSENSDKPTPTIVIDNEGIPSTSLVTTGNSVVSSEANNPAPVDVGNTASINDNNNAVLGDGVSTASSPSELNPENGNSPVNSAGSTDTNSIKNIGNPSSDVSDKVDVSSPNVISSESNNTASDKVVNVDSPTITDILSNSPNTPSISGADNASSLDTDLVSSGNNDITITKNDDSSISGIVENEVPPTVSSPQKKEVNSENNINVPVPSISGVVSSADSKVDSSNANVSTISENNSANTILPVTANAIPPTTSIVSSDGNDLAAENNDNVESTNALDTKLNPITSNGVSETASVNVEVISTTLPISLQSDNSGIAPSASNDVVVSNNVDIVYPNVADNTTPVTVIEDAAESIKKVSVNNTTSSTGIDIQIIAANNSEITSELGNAASKNNEGTGIVSSSSFVSPSGGVDDVKGLTLPPPENDATPTDRTVDTDINRGNVDVVNNADIASADTPTTITDVNTNIDSKPVESIDTSSNNVDTAILPEVIDPTQVQNIDTPNQTVTITTESVVNSEKEKEAITTVSNINTVPNIVTEATLITSQSSTVDTVLPAELTTPLDQSADITIPIEEGASVVEILSQ